MKSINIIDLPLAMPLFIDIICDARCDSMTYTRPHGTTPNKLYPAILKFYPEWEIGEKVEIIFY
jgi:hypothetical protein